MHIKLIGKPAILGPTGEQRFLRGKQIWAVLARILLSSRALDRRGLANELFPEADDPQGALRWCLASLRRALDAPHALAGDPIEANLPEAVSVDVLEMGTSPLDETCLGEFLEGVEPKATPQFSTWLLVERARIAGLIEERLRKETMQALSARDGARAVKLAEWATTRAPLDESTHVLFARSLVLTGMAEEALAHVEETEKLFMADLGERPSPALRAALRTAISSANAVSSSSNIRSLLDAGRAAVQAGAIDSGLELLRRSLWDAEAVDDAGLQSEASLALGEALVHSVRGYDDEGAILLQQAFALSRQRGDTAVQAEALRELGYVDALAGRRPSAAEHLRTALELGKLLGKSARMESVIAFNLVDWGRFEEGLSSFASALSNACSEGDRLTEIWTLGLGSWGYLAAGDYETALKWSSDCLVKAGQSNWLAFRPFPMAVRAEAELRLGADPAGLREQLENAFALSCQLRDPCWEGAVARSIGLTYATEGNFQAALDWLANARRRCVRESDTYMALLVRIIADQADVSLRMGHLAQAEWTTRELLSMAARTHADHLVRSALSNLNMTPATDGSIRAD